MSAQPQTPEFSFTIEIADLPPTGRSYAIEGSPEEHARVAHRLGLQAVEALKARFEVVPGAGGIVGVTGEVEAKVVQTCVVSLAPVPAAIKEPLALQFAEPKPPAKVKAKHAEDEEEIILAEGEDPPELAIDGRIDLGEVAVSQLALALDPYPRAPGVAFDAAKWTGEAEKGPGDSPFAALAKLKPSGRS